MEVNATKNLFSDACRFKDFTIKIYDNKSKNEIEFKNKEIKEGEISYNGFIIYSWFILNGAGDVQTHLKLSEDAGFIPFILDLGEQYYRREFHLVGFSKKDTISFKTITIQGQDEISYILSKLHISKTYKNVKLCDIFQDIYKSFVLPRLKRQNIDLELESNIIIENFVVTPQKSVLDFIFEECERQGLNLFQDKSRIVMKSYKNLSPSSLNLSKALYNNLKVEPNSPFDILSYKFNNSNKIHRIPKSQILAYDKSNKTMKIMKRNLEDMEFDVPVESQNQKDGFEYISQEYPYDDNIYAETYKSFLNVNSVDIVVPGNVGDIKIFDRFKIIFKMEDDAINEYVGNIKNSGEYILTKYVEKITAQLFYIVKLTLSRFKTNDT